MKKEGKKKDITIRQIIDNNIHAIKLMWGISPRRVVHMAISPFIGYLSWMFYSTYFIRYVVNSIESGAPFRQILTYIAIVCAVTATLQLYAAYVRNVTIPIDDVKVYSELYKKLYKKAQNAEVACFEDSKFYNKYTMALDNACERITGVADMIFHIIAALTAGIFTYSAMYRIDKMMLFFIAAPLIGNFLFGAMLNKLSFRMYKQMTPNNRRAEYVNRVMYLSDYSKEIRLSNIFNVLRRIFDKSVTDNIGIVKKYRSRSVPLSFFHFYFSYTIIFEGILLYGAYCALISKTMTPGELAILTSMMTTASWMLLGMADRIMKLGQNGMFMHNIRTFLNHSETIPEDHDGDIPDTVISSIEFRNVSFSYGGQSEPVIKELSFIMDEGKVVALVGHNGAGKTTIIKLLLRLYDPTSGEILVNGKNIKEYNLQAYRKLYAAAFQDYKIFSGTVKANVLMNKDIPNPEETAADALIRAGVYEKVMELKNGMDTILTKEFDEDGAVLSGGEFQKIVVARAFADPAPVKIFDEPSSALDPIAEHELFESILEESKGRMMIFISHRLSSVKNAGEVLMLENGEIIERGTHFELMEKNGKYAEMYSKQAKNYQPSDEADKEAV